LNKLILITLLSSILLTTAHAESMYVDDTLLVPLRSGEGTSFRIVHKGIKSGTKLEIIEANRVSGYSKVLTPGGIEGYLPTRYLSAAPIAKIRLAKANKELSSLKSENATLTTKLADITQVHKKLSSAHKKTSSELSKNSQELSSVKSISANALNLDRRNRELRESNEQLRNELELVQTENTHLKDKSDSNMMLIGGGLVIFGAILALIIPLIRPSKKNESWA